MRRLYLAVACAVLIAVIGFPSFYVFWYVPHSLGRQYVSVSFSPEAIGIPGLNQMHVAYQGEAFNATFVSIRINVTNSYFQPVYVGYNGFDVVWLIYNKTVSNPSDVTSNKNFLVWGAYYYLVYEAIQDPNKGVHDFTGDGFEFYASRRNSSNFQTAIPTGTTGESYGTTGILFFSPDGLTPGFWYGQYYSNVTWNGQYYSNLTSFVSPGPYFMYCIIYGILCPPQNITVTSTGPIAGYPPPPINGAFYP